VRNDALARTLRVLVITDAALAAPRPVPRVVASALAAGARAIQLRSKGSTARELLALTRELLALTRPAGALLFVNDRFDVALAGGADGAHLGPEDVPLAAARRVVPPGFLLGASTDDPDHARRAEAEGADYIGCGAVWRTGTKDVGGEEIGTERLRAVVGAVRIPVVAIGGITVQRAREVAPTGAAGVAVVRTVMAATDPSAEVRGLLGAFEV
jgi:thiamine-phosphate pyrophosphorylase